MSRLCSWFFRNSCIATKLSFNDYKIQCNKKSMVAAVKNLLIRTLIHMLSITIYYNRQWNGNTTFQSVHTQSTRGSHECWFHYGVVPWYPKPRAHPLKHCEHGKQRELEFRIQSCNLNNSRTVVSRGVPPYRIDVIIVLVHETLSECPVLLSISIVVAKANLHLVEAPYNHPLS